ncbi:hypothetical protein SLEP1_g38516 [Rubroshorea leprosula]|nr:hypothetical protein SLEP1_g38516 [Rubroshorea leprosula]
MPIYIVAWFPPGEGDDKNSEKRFLSLFSNHHGYHIPEKGIAFDRVVGFQDIGGKDHFSTEKLEVLLLKNGVISEKKDDEDDEDEDYHENTRRTVRSSVNHESDMD